VSGGGAVRALSIPETLDRLRSPDAFEIFSPVGGAGFLAVDAATDAPGVGEGELADAWRLAMRLPCPVVALVGDAPSKVGSALAEVADAQVASDDELAAVAATVRRAPLASLALVQLLRDGEGRDVESGLFAESLAYSMLQTGPEFAAWLASRPERASPRTPSAAPLRVDRDGARLRLVLDAPEKRNAFSAAMRDALVEGLRIAVLDPSVEEVLLEGAGPAFCAGGDLDEFGTLPDPATAHAVRSTRSAARLLAACAERVIARIRGACVGAGIELPAFAGRVVAAPDAWFQLPELAMGLVPGAGGTVSLPRRIGRQRSAWLALSGRALDVETALRFGLVDAID
jgi:enoyl-CoA hydratase/carnithine racemase